MELNEAVMFVESPVTQLYGNSLKYTQNYGLARKGEKSYKDQPPFSDQSMTWTLTP